MLSGFSQLVNRNGCVGATFCKSEKLYDQRVFNLSYGIRGLAYAQLSSWGRCTARVTLSVSCEILAPSFGDCPHTTQSS